MYECINSFTSLMSGKRYTYGALISEVEYHNLPYQERIKFSKIREDQRFIPTDPVPAWTLPADDSPIISSSSPDPSDFGGFGGGDFGGGGSGGDFGGGGDSGGGGGD